MRSHTSDFQLLLDCWLLRQLADFQSKPRSGKSQQKTRHEIKLSTYWSFWALIPSEIQLTMFPALFEPSLASVSLRVIWVRVGAFFQLTLNILRCLPLSSIAKCSKDLQASTGRLHWIHVLVNCSNAGPVESKPIWLLLYLVMRVDAKKKQYNEEKTK